MENRTIIQQIQPQCDNLYKNIKKVVNDQHRTHRDIVEHTGIPRSTIAKFLSGALSNPCVFYIAALCRYLNVSMDSLFDIEPPKQDTETNVAELQAKLEGAEKQIVLLKERSKLLESGIKERKPVIYGLAGLCVFLTVALLSYILMDINDPEHGLLTESTFSDRIGLICVLAVAVVLALLHFIAKIIIHRKRDKENDNLI